MSSVVSRNDYAALRLAQAEEALTVRDIWALRVQLHPGSRGELVLFNLGIDNKLRGCR